MPIKKMRSQIKSKKNPIQIVRGKIRPGQKISAIHFAPRHCSLCGHALKSNWIEEESLERLQCQDCAHIEYLNPKVVAGAIVVKDGKWLFLRRGIEPQLGQWTYPAGFAELGETVPDAAIRETWEETGIKVIPRGVLGVYSYTDTSVAVIVYWAEAVGGKPTLTRESLEVAYLSPSKIPWQDLAFRSTEDALVDALKIWKKKQSPVQKK